MDPNTISVALLMFNSPGGVYNTNYKKESP